MNRTIVTVLAIISLACIEATAENGSKIVLPDFKLAGSSVPNLSQVWQDHRSTDAGAIYPKMITIDMDNGVVQGLTTIYDKTASIDERKASINERYGKFVIVDDEYVKVWRVEPEKFAISLAVADDGMKQLIYLKFSAKTVRPGWKCKFSK